MSKSITKGAYTGPEAFRRFTDIARESLVDLDVCGHYGSVVLFEEDGDYWIGLPEDPWPTFRARRLPKVAYEVMKAVYGE
jgi:hypothetical protein